MAASRRSFIGGVFAFLFAPKIAPAAPAPILLKARQPGLSTINPRYVMIQHVTGADAGKFGIYAFGEGEKKIDTNKYFQYFTNAQYGQS